MIENLRAAAWLAGQCILFLAFMGSMVLFALMPAILR